MKKLHVLALLVAVVIAGGGWMFFLRRSTGPRRDAAELLPATTCFFIHLPDLSRTAERWPATSLHEIAAEPQWQEFVRRLPPDLEERILASIPQKLFVVLYQQWRSIDPVEIFFAELSPDSPSASAPPWSSVSVPGFSTLWRPGASQQEGEQRYTHWKLDPHDRMHSVPTPTPRFVTIGAGNFLNNPASPLVVGVRYRGKKSEILASLKSIRAELFRGLAAPTSVLVRVAGAEIEQLSSQGTTLAFAYVDDWIFVSNRVDPLKDLLRRLAREAAAPPSLAVDPGFVEARQQALPDPDLRIFYRWDEGRRAAANAFGENLFPVRMPRPPNVKSVTDAADAHRGKGDNYFPESLGYTLKLEGRLVRDRFSLRMPHVRLAPSWRTPLGRWVPPESLVAGALNLEGRTNLLRWELNAAGLGVYGAHLLPHLSFQESDQWIGDIGPELSWHYEWREDSVFLPTFVLVTEFHHPDRASALATSWAFRHHGNEPDVPRSPQTPVFSIGPVVSTEFIQQTLGLQGRHVAYGDRRYATERALRLAVAGGESLAQNSSFQSALQTVPAPTVGWVYVDFRRIVEQAVLDMDGHLPLILSPPGPTFAPWEACILEHVPDAGAIGPHILPVAASIRDLPTGFVVESTGSIPLGSWLWAWFWHLDQKPLPNSESFSQLSTQ